MNDPVDPVITAALEEEAAQAAYDAAMVSGCGLSVESRHGLATRLALARRKLRSAIYSRPDNIDETATLTHMLPALEPVKPDEE